MKTFRFLAVVSIVGAFVGIVLATLAAPPLLASQLCGLTSDASTSRPCLATVADATSGLVRTQEIGALLGAIVGLGIGGAFLRRKKDAPTGPAPGAPVA